MQQPMLTDWDLVQVSECGQEDRMIFNINATQCLLSYRTEEVMSVFYQFHTSFDGGYEDMWPENMSKEVEDLKKCFLH